MSNLKRYDGSNWQPIEIDADKLGGKMSSSFQDKLISGTNIKTINGSNILGSGNITISTSVPTASSTTLGGIKIGFNNPSNPEDYPVQLDARNKAYVNIPIYYYEGATYGECYEIDAPSDEYSMAIGTSGFTVDSGAPGGPTGSSNILQVDSDKFTYNGNQVITSGNLKTINGNSLVGSGNINTTDDTKLPLTGGTISGDVTVNKNMNVGGSLTVGNKAVLTDHQLIKTLKTDNTAAQTPSANESIAGSGTINLHKVSKTGSYNDLENKPDLSKYATLNTGAGTDAVPAKNGTVSISNKDGKFTIENNVTDTKTKLTIEPGVFSIIYNSGLFGECGFKVSNGGHPYYIFRGTYYAVMTEGDVISTDELNAILV